MEILTILAGDLRGSSANIREFAIVDFTTLSAILAPPLGWAICAVIFSAARNSRLAVWECSAGHAVSPRTGDVLLRSPRSLLLLAYGARRRGDTESTLLRGWSGSHY
mgnify:CR=1 FL=1|jgi:hypothetical protein